MCGLRTRPRRDVDLPRFLDRTAIGEGHIVSPPPRGDTLLTCSRPTLQDGQSQTQERVNFSGVLTIDTGV